MSSFTTPLVLIAPDDNGEWELSENFEYYDNDGTTFLIPKGFKTDFASVPRALWSIFPPYGKYGKAAVLHDYFYRTKVLSKRDSDIEFLNAMTVLKVPYVTRKLMYYAVKYFGHSSYK